MSEENKAPSELETLKSQADTLGIKYRKDITEDTLRAKVEEAKAKPAANDEGATEKAPAKESEGQKRARLKKEASKLVRVRVTCMNPNKREYDGDMFCAGNRFIGTFKRFVPFDVEWHVPMVIFKMMKRRQCQVFVSKRDDRGRQIKEGKQINEFNVEVLPDLSQEELDDLANRQAMASGTAAA